VEDTRTNSAHHDPVAKMKIYTASKTKHAEKWRKLRLQHRVIATWIDEAGEGQTADRSELATRCVKEIVQCDFLLFYCERDEIPKGALIEVGIALAFRKQIRFVGFLSEAVRSVFCEHPLWRHFATIDEAINTKWPTT
jgi:hypothetical protein